MSYLIYLIILFAMSAFFSASETAFFSVSAPELNRLKEKGSPSFGRISYLRSDPRRLIITIMIGGEIANISISSIFTGIFTRNFASASELISLVVSTFAILMFGDLIPKSIAFVHATSYVNLASFPLKYFMKIITPVRLGVEKIATMLFSIFSIQDSDEFLIFSESKFRTLVDEGEKSGEVDRSESALIHNIFELGDKKALEVMTPINDVFMIDQETDFREVVSLIKKYRHSRIPVYRSDRDDIVGILYFKEILKHVRDHEGQVVWTRYLKEPYFVPETKRLSNLLSDLRKMKIHMSVVIDEFGDVSGIVTMEDILEELFGEIRDEYDTAEADLYEIDEKVKVVSGKMSIDDFNEIFHLPSEESEYETVAGLILHLFGYLPKKGEIIEYSGLTLTVERLKGIRILDVRVEEKGDREAGNGI